MVTRVRKSSEASETAGDFHNPISNKSQTLDRPTVRSQEQSFKVLEEIIKQFRQIVRALEKPLAIR